MTWTAQRPWPARGNNAFDALVAPFLVDSYDLQRAILEDPIAGQMISSVKGAGLAGIGVLPGPLRFIAAHEPVHAPGDLKGSVIGIDDTWVGRRPSRRWARTVAAIKTDTLEKLTGAVAQLEPSWETATTWPCPTVAAGVPFSAAPGHRSDEPGPVRCPIRRPATHPARRGGDVHRAPD